MVSVFLLVLLSVAALVQAGPTVRPPHPVDCDDVYRTGSTHSGVYTIYPHGYGKSVQVYCDMDCEEDGKSGGWTVIQRRIDGTVNFYRPWEQYKEGFGNVSGEHWLGLENMFAITWQRKYRLRVDMEDFEGGNVHGCYKSFFVDSEADGYRLHVDAYIDGGAGNHLSESNGKRFTTFDKDQDDYYFDNHAEKYHGGFWFGYHVNANPNGLYKWGRHSDYRSGVLWGSWKGYYYSLKAITMKIRPVPLEEAGSVRRSSGFYTHYYPYSPYPYYN